jgi:hypothetical protein
MSKTAKYLLTRELFDEIDCCEAVLSLNYATLPASVVQVCIWGIVFHLDKYPLPQALQANVVSPQADIFYLPAWSTMTFDGVAVVELTVAPYRPTLQRNAAGFMGINSLVPSNVQEILELSQRWEGQTQAGAIHVYGFDCVLEHPYGYCSLRIHATGEVNLSYRPDLLVPLADLQSDPNKVGWWEVGRLRA